MKAVWDRIGAAFAFVCCLVAALLWQSGYVTTLQRLAPVTTLQGLLVSVPETAAVQIGRNELLQRDIGDAAEAEHLLLVRDGRGQLFVANTAEKRRLFLGYEATGHFAHEAVLQDGDELRLLGHSFVVAINDGTLTLRDAARDLEEPRLILPVAYPSNDLSFAGLQAGRVLFGGTLETNPERDGLGSWLQRWELRIKIALSPVLSRDTPYQAPPIRAAFETLPEDAFQITAEAEGRFVLRPRGVRVIEHCHNGSCHFLGRQFWPYEDTKLGGKLDRVTMGRTTYRVTDNATQVLLVPQSRHHWWPETDAKPEVSDEFLPRTSKAFFRGLSKPVVDGERGILSDMISGFFSTPLSIGLVPAAVLFGLLGLALGRDRYRVQNSLLWHSFAVLCIGLAVLLPLNTAPGLSLLANRLEPAGIFLVIYALFCVGSGLLRTTTGILAILGILIITIVGVFGMSVSDAVMSPDLARVYGRDLHVGVHAASLLFLVAGFALFMVGCAPVLLIFWAALTGLVGLGVINGALLSLGQDYALHTRLFSTHVAVIGLIGFFAAMATLAPRDKIRHGLTSIFLGRGVWGLPTWVLAVTSLLVALGLAAVTFIGTEEGFGGVQPIEFSKSIIILFLATYLVTLNQLSIIRAATVNFVGSLAVLGVSIGALMAASFLNFDLSPILIALTTLAVIGVVYAIFVTLQWLRALQAAVILIAVPVITLALEFPPFSVFALTLVALCLILSLAMNADKDKAILPAPVARARGGAIVDRSVLVNLLNDKDRFFERLFTLHGRRLVGGAVSISVFLFLVALAVPIITPMTQSERLETFETALPRTPTERLVSWYDATLFGNREDSYRVEFPDFSFQVRKSREVLAVSGCDQIESLRRAIDSTDMSKMISSTGIYDGLRGQSQTLCATTRREIGAFPRQTTPHPVLYSVPAVQDDFVATFFVANFGWEMTLLLVMLQVTLLVSMIMIAVSAFVTARHDRRLRGHGMLSGFATGGFAIMIGLQFGLSWANVLGLLPVVGQPMTFLSFGGSHHLLFGLPLVLFTVLMSEVLRRSRQVLNENRDRRHPFGWHAQSHMTH